MTNCKNCGRKLLMGNCIHFSCSTSSQSIVDSRNKSSQKNQISSSKNTLPDLSKPIPPGVNSRKYTKKRNLKSILVYLKYSRAKDQTDHLRQHQLRIIIDAGPFIPSANNQDYVISFKSAGTQDRVRAIIDLLKWQIKGQRPRYEGNLEKYGKYIPSLEKAEADVLWLESIIDEYS